MKNTTLWYTVNALLLKQIPKERNTLIQTCMYKMYKATTKTKTMYIESTVLLLLSFNQNKMKLGAIIRKKLCGSLRIAKKR